MKQFNIGDKLRIRQWDDMAKEFGVVDNEIMCHHGFPETMRHLCGLPFTVIDIEYDEYYSEEGTEGLRDDDWSDYWLISADMLEYAEEPAPPLSCDIDGLFELSFGGVV